MDSKTSALHDIKLHVRLKLSALWTSLMFCYVYGDYFGLYRPNSLKHMLDGRMDPLGLVTQGMLLGTAAMMAVPSLMMALSLLLPAVFARWMNIVFGAVYAAIILVTLPGAWMFYIFFGVIEIALSALVVGYAWRWPRSAPQPSHQHT